MAGQINVDEKKIHTNCRYAYYDSIIIPILKRRGHFKRSLGFLVYQILYGQRSVV